MRSRGGRVQNTYPRLRPSVIAAPLPALGLALLLAMFTGCATRPDPNLQQLTVGHAIDPLNPPELRRIEPAYLSTHSYRVLDFGIAPWFRFHRSALSLTFDDGTLDQFLLAAPELEGRGLAATFFLITGAVETGWWQDGPARRRLLSWDQARRLSRAGHELASHGVTHAKLLGRDELVREELENSRQRIDREIRARSCVSFCWPYWKCDEASRALAGRYYLSARAGGPSPQRYPGKNGGIPPPEPPDLYQINCMGILSRDQFEDWRGAGQGVLDRGGWAVLNFHGIDDGRIDREALGWSALPMDSFRALLDHIVGLDLWIAPYGRVTRYIRERRAATLHLTDWRPSSIALVLEDGEDDAVFDQALTLRLRLPAGWRGARAEQDGQLFWSRTDEEGFLHFDAFPNGKTIILTRTDPGGGTRR